MNYDVEKIWTTKTGLLAVVIRANRPGFSHRCGYVLIPKEHPLYGVESNKPSPILTKFSKEKNLEEQLMGKRGVIPVLFRVIKEDIYPNYYFDVHGSITYSGISGSYPISEETSGVGWWYGFDTNHYDDQDDPKSLEYCEQECESLATQLEEIK
jgi:hypothetical protein